MSAVAYLCDRRACKRCSYPLCRHTLDITHAVNFTQTSVGVWCEKESTAEEEASNDTDTGRS